MPIIFYVSCDSPPLAGSDEPCPSKFNIGRSGEIGSSIPAGWSRVDRFVESSTGAPNGGVEPTRFFCPRCTDRMLLR